MDDIDTEKTGNRHLYVYRKEACKFWWCALPYVDEKGRRKQFRKCFRDSRYRDKYAALGAALDWRDAQLGALKRWGTLGAPDTGAGAQRRRTTPPFPALARE